MSDAPSADDVRKALLAVIRQHADGGRDRCFSREYVITQTVQTLGQRHDTTTVRRVMDAWDDLYRAGIVGYGMDMANLGFGWSHFTEYGTEAVRDLDRDPSNPAAYRKLVETHLKDEPLARAYLDESLATYNQGTFS